jgi:hypothetical protein
MSNSTDSADPMRDELPVAPASKPAVKEPGSSVLARASVMPSIGSAYTRSCFLPKAFDGVDIGDHAKSISDKCGKVVNGKMDGPEALLMAHALTLDAMFNDLAQRAAKNIGVHLPATEAYMRMALKAQAQCAATIRVLGELKSPKQVAFIKQANVAHGHQQVNNGAPAEAAADAARAHEEKPIQSNELLTEQHGTTLDFGATGGASRGYQAMEAVGEVDRARD